MKRDEFKVNKSFQRSCFLQPTVGNRPSPEGLLQELFREVFFKHGEENGSKSLELSSGESDEEAALLYALCGRRKANKRKDAPSEFFVAPAYPALARHAWSAKNRERLLRDCLFGGALAQYYRGSSDSAITTKKEKQLENTCRKITLALRGHHSASADSRKNKEILSAPIRNNSFDPEIDNQECEDRISDSVWEKDNRLFCQKGGDGQEDPLARRIHDDFVTLCELEEFLPRLQWLQLILGFLRFALPMWVLARMRSTEILNESLKSALNSDAPKSEQSLLELISNRHTKLIPLPSTSIKLIDHKVSSYVKARIEASLILDLLEDKKISELQGRKLVIRRPAPNKTEDEVDLPSVLQDINTWLTKHPNDDLRTQVWRSAEKVKAFRDPVKTRGVGQQLHYFLRGLRKASAGDSGQGYLLTPVGTGKESIVFPGPLLIRTISILAERAIAKERGTEKKGVLLVSDLEKHFSEYGIDFHSWEGARPKLLRRLEEMSLLNGSPDAGASAQVRVPEAVKVRDTN